MKKSIILTIILAVAMPFAAFAQNILKGTVEDAIGPIPGVMLLNQTSGKWATTDQNGNYTIEDVNIGDILQVSCLGYNTRDIVWNGESPLTIILEEQAFELYETIVIGYGSVKKKDLTGSVGVLNSDILQQQSKSQLSQSLQGTIPGLVVTRSSSMPGASASIQIRGVTTISDSSPLILVDGMAVNNIDNVSPEDVEQITILKDAASASIYGARAAAGVILITTKSAREGEVKIGYNGELSMVKATEFAEYLTDPYNYMTMFNEYKWNDAGNPAGGDYQQYSQELIENYYNNYALDPITYPNFDWKSNILKNQALRHKHNVTLTYGNKIVKTRASVSYEKSDALYPGSNHERLMARIRNSINFAKNWSAAVDFSLKHAVKNDPQTGSPIKAANMYPSIYAGLYPDGRVAEGKTGSNTLGALLEGGHQINANNYITGKISLSWKPLEGLDVTGSITPTYSFTKQKDFIKAVPYYDAYDTDVLLGYVSGYTATGLTEVRADAKTWETQLIATYEKSFANAHNINVMAGYEDYMYTFETMTASTNEMELRNYPYLDLANTNNLGVSGGSYQNAYRSFFGRIMYNFKGRYYLQLNARGDASSRFHKDYRWGFFPSASVGWVISNEGFMQNFTPVSYLKLRASIGSLGNERIGNYPYQSSINFNKAIMYDSNGQNLLSQMTGAQINYAVRDITWETTNSWDVGLDATLFDHRLNLTFDYYYKETRDMLLAAEIPTFTGYGAPDQNVGTMHTRGWEVIVGWKDEIGDFRYGFSVNLSDYRSIMGDLKGKMVFFSDGTIIKEGEEYRAWYGYKSDGLWQSDPAEGDAVLIPTTSAGDVRYIDLSGDADTPDGKITATYDRTILGSSLPHFVFGGIINLGWKNFSLSVLFNGVGKQNSLVTQDMVRPFVSQWLSAPAVLHNSDGTRNHWSVYNTEEQNLSVRYPRLSYTSAEKNNYAVSDYWLMNGAYFRVKNINLSYQVPQKSLDKVGIKGLRIFFNADDPFCFDNYLKGWDPEAGPSTYIAKTFTLGIDLNF
ncbi:MAG: TonB-dependent receptor [Bacteroidales bacterium]|nr:TonB-dependent receptor [Bacteroidales bacterium]MDD3521332.1 TonB-dependent receptor [Bacteroidales bacterium]MDD4030604.1 TonB-dependent receptor [Bacteroidales bacterium]MDD4434707.1 TonB-dependent receptor [Bacteroidales bacterium]MDD5732181.1 TonB-dependent receptor [Bacteroidales bacterium]